MEQRKDFLEFFQVVEKLLTAIRRKVIIFSIRLSIEVNSLNDAGACEHTEMRCKVALSNAEPSPQLAETQFSPC